MNRGLVYQRQGIFNIPLLGEQLRSAFPEVVAQSQGRQSALYTFEFEGPENAATGIRITLDSSLTVTESELDAVVLSHDPGEQAQQELDSTAADQAFQVEQAAREQLQSAILAFNISLQTDRDTFVQGRTAVQNATVVNDFKVILNGIIDVLENMADRDETLGQALAKVYITFFGTQ